MYFDYLNALVFASVGFFFVFINVIIGSIIRPRRKGTQGLEVYECGEETLGDTWIKFDIRYYTVALVYVIFAVEVGFLFPVFGVFGDIVDGNVSTIGSLALVHVLVFVVVLFFGLVAVWAKGDLDWVMTYKAKEWTPTNPRTLPLARTVAALEEELSPTEESTEESTEAEDASDEGNNTDTTEAPAPA
jgi:NADH-quinone oxidoreductase subunit A